MRPKRQLLSLIRHAFPLEESDKRRENLPSQAIISLQQIHELFSRRKFQPTDSQKKIIYTLLQELSQQIFL